MEDRHPIMELRNVYASYGRVRALTDLTLRVNAGEIVTLLGANGAGKTTCLNTICGVLAPTQGDIFFCGQRINGIAPERAIHLGIGHVPERRQLFHSMSVMDNLLLGAYCRRGRRHRKEVERDLASVFELFPILRERKNQVSGTLSGGQQQMLAVGRGLMARPKLLLLDEPSLGLAPLLIEEVMRVTSELKTRGLTVLLVEQNASAALSIADRGYVLSSGHIVMEGTAAELLDDEQIRATYLGDARSGNASRSLESSANRAREDNG